MLEHDGSVFGDDSGSHRGEIAVGNGVVLNAIFLLHHGKLEMIELEDSHRYPGMS